MISLFLLKIAAGIGYAKYFAQPQYIAGADTWRFYKASLTETNWLLHDPAGFIKDYFYSPYRQNSNLFAGSNSYWNDLDYNTFVKGLAMVNVVTGDSYYADVILFNFVFFFGPVALYRLSKPLWKYNKLILLIPVFLLPSFLFWCSGLHKDGLIFMCLAMSIFCLQKQLRSAKFRFTESLVMIFCFLLLFALRNAIFILLLPALTAYFFSYKKPASALYYFAGMYLAGILLFFLSPYISSSLNLPQYVVNKQAEFTALSGNSKIDLPILQSSISSFTNFFPFAFDLIFFQPHAGELKNAAYVMSFLENTCIITLGIASVLFQKINKRIPPLLLLFLFLSLSVLLLCGYTVTFIGAIIRYKSIMLPFFSLFFLLSISNKFLFFLKLIK